MFTDLDFLDDNNDWGRWEYQLAALYPEPVRSPLDRPKPKRSCKFNFWWASNLMNHESFNPRKQWCVE